MSAEATVSSGVRLRRTLLLAAAAALLWTRPLPDLERTAHPQNVASARLPGGSPPPVAASRDAAGAVPAVDAATLDRRALDAWRAGDIGKAMALFEQAVALAPQDPAPHSHYGRLLTLMVAYERAIPLLEHARDLVPEDAQAWLDLATAYERAQRFDDAWAARARAAELVGADAITRDGQGRFIVAGEVL